MGMDTTIIPSTYTAGAGITVSGSAISIGASAIVESMLNASIVGIDRATGKIAAINATNFSNLSGANLTGIAGALVEIASGELAGAASSIDVTGISTTYDGFIVMVHALRTGGSYLNMNMTLNADGANWTNKQLRGSGSLAVSDTAGGLTNACQIATSTDVAIVHAVITKPLTSMKALVNSSFGSDSATASNVGVWNNTADKITQITINASDGQFAIGTSYKILGWIGA